MKPKLTFISKLYDLYKAAGVAILTLGLAFLMNDLSGFHFMGILVGISVVAFILLLFFIEQNRKNVMAYIILAGMVLLFFILMKLLQMDAGKIWTGAMEYIRKCNRPEWEYSAEYAYLWGVAISFLIAVIVFFIQKLRMARFLTAGILWIGMIVLGFLQIEIGRMAVMYLLLYCLINLSDICNLLYNKNVLLKDSENVAFYLLPFCLLMVILVAVLPVNKHPIEWKTVKTVYQWAINTTQNTIANIQMGLGIEDREYGMAFTGYSGKGKLGSGLTKNTTDQFLVKSSKTQGNVYIIGSVFDTYTGKSWEKKVSKVKKQEKEYRMDYYEFLYALASDEKKLLERMESVNRENIDITFGGIRTSTVFYPQKMFFIKPISKFQYDDYAPNAVFEEVRSEGTRYEAEYLDINYGNASIQELLRNMDDFEYKTTKLNLTDIIDYMGQYDVETASILRKTDIPKNMNIPENINILFLERADQIQKGYTSLPQNVPKRVYELANEITEDCTNDYDKSKAIEEYLNTYTYTFSPEKLDEKDEFVDHFLFETKEGYCTYFATAMAIMARTQGIPTRYVEGFCLDYGNYMGNDMFQITGGDAHAWCEVYIEGAGWIPFEATAGKKEMRYKEWSMDASYKSNVLAISGNMPEKQEVEEENADDRDQLSEQDFKNRIQSSVIFAFCIISFLIVFLVIYYVLLKRQREKKYRNCNRNMKISLLFLNMIKVMELRGHSIDDSSTVTDIYLAMEQVLEVENETSSLLREIYFRSRYSNEEATLDDLEIYERVNSKVEDEYLKRCRLWKKLDYKMFKKVI